MSKQAMGMDPLGFIKDTQEPQVIKSQKPVLNRVQDKPQPPIKLAKTSVAKKAVGRPVTYKREILKTSQEGLPENWTRATYIVRESIVEQLKAVAYWERKQVKQVIEEAFQNYLADKEIKPIPSLN